MTFDFFVVGYKGLETLKAFCKAGRQQHIQTVIAAKDTNMINDYFEEIKGACQEYSLKFNEKADANFVSTADYVFVIGWRWMIGSMNNTIVLHDSILPAYRGFSPLVNALINGDTTIGATALWATDRYDAGPIIIAEKAEIQHPIRIQKAIELMSELYIKIVLKITDELLEAKIPRSNAQDESKASYSLWRDEGDYTINWQDDSEKILRTIYSLSYPYRGANTLLYGAKVTINNAAMVNDVRIVDRQPGKVIFMQEDFPVVVCGKGLLKITEAVDESGVSMLPLKKFRTRFGC